MPKPEKKPKQLLTPELVQKLKDDGYCFISDHEEEIKQLKEKLSQKDAETKAALTKQKEDYEAQLVVKDAMIAEMGQAQAEMAKEYREAMGMTQTIVNKLKQEIAPELRKQFEEEARKKNACYDIEHQSNPFRYRVEVDMSEMYTFATLLMARDIKAPFSIPPVFTVYVPMAFQNLADVAIKKTKEAQQKIMGRIMGAKDRASRYEDFRQLLRNPSFFEGL